MSPGKGTPIRPVRVSDELWAKALAKAGELGVSVSEVIRDALEAFVEDE